MKQQKVSVIIPIYNGEKTLEKCLKSVLNQTYKNYEILTIDNNSTDSTKNIIQKFRKKNKRIKYLFEQKKGRGNARNKGIENTTGKIILMTDSDCIVPKNWIEEIAKPIVEENEKIVIGSEEDPIENYWTKNIQKHQTEGIFKLKKRNYIEFLDTKNFGILSSILKKEKFNPKMDRVEDTELFIRLRKKWKVRFLPELKVKHYHKQNFNEWFKLSFERGYWNAKLYLLYKNNPEITKLHFFSKLSPKKLILFPAALLVFSAKNNLHDLKFILTTEISWYLGALKAILLNK